MKKITFLNDSTIPSIYQIIESFTDYQFEISNEFDFFEFFKSDSDVFVISAASALIPNKTWKVLLEKYFLKTNKILIIGGAHDTLHDVENLIFRENFDMLFKTYQDRIKFLYVGVLESNLEKRLSKFKITCLSDYEHFNDSVLICPEIKTIDAERKNKFLLTTILKKMKHRQLLKIELEKENLLKYHIGKISEKKDYDNWDGLVTKNSIIRPDAFISWDLYNSSSFEIVPETRGENFTYMTEKTIKPIMAKLPFLILSNKDYYSHLKQFGFKTFDSLIDESFAYEDNLETRVRKLVQTAKHILDNGAIDFYNASQEICDHNKEHMFYFAKKQENMYYQNIYNFFNKLD